MSRIQGRLTKLYPAVVKQVIIFMYKNNARSEDDHRLISSRRFFWCTFVGGANAGTGETEGEEGEGD